LNKIQETFTSVGSQIKTRLEAEKRDIDRAIEERQRQKGNADPTVSATSVELQPMATPAAPDMPVALPEAAPSLYPSLAEDAVPSGPTVAVTAEPSSPVSPYPPLQ
jgi:hypothetical protein